MAHTPETKNKVRTLYVRQRLPLTDAAAAAGVSYHTARGWKKKAEQQGDDWDRARSASRLAEGGLGDLTHEVIEQFALLFQATIEQLRSEPVEGESRDPIQTAEALAKLADAYTKTVRAAGATDPKLARLSIALEVLELQGRFITERFPDDLERFTLILEQFGAYLSSEFK